MFKRVNNITLVVPRPLHDQYHVILHKGSFPVQRTTIYTPVPGNEVNFSFEQKQFLLVDGSRTRLKEKRTAFLKFDGITVGLTTQQTAPSDLIMHNVD